MMMILTIMITTTTSALFLVHILFEQHQINFGPPTKDVRMLEDVYKAAGPGPITWDAKMLQAVYEAAVKLGDFQLSSTNINQTDLNH